MMESLKELFKIGNGPSSSHTMGPAKAAKIFKNKYKNATSFTVTLYSSLAATGKGHLTDKVLLDVLGRSITKIIFHPEMSYDYHPNAMLFEAFDDKNKLGEWLVFSVGGGSLKNLNEDRTKFIDSIYKERSMKEIIDVCKKNNISLPEYVYLHEQDIKEYLKLVLNAMFDSVNEGICTSGILQGGLNVERKAPRFYQEYLNNHDFETLAYAATLGVAEVNASGGIIVTAPTCGASGVLPGIIYAKKIFENIPLDKLIDSLAVAGLIGNLVKTNGSISGAEVGCQGEVGVACAMAAAACCYLQGGTFEEIEYAAEIALEHHLGMTCDPINGLVQIPCIERNAVAAIQALNCAKYAILSAGHHYISLDHVIEVMKETGHDLSSNYKETSKGGLAKKSK